MLPREARIGAVTIDASALAALQREVVNFRDAGGARSRFGGTVIAGRLYRSGHLAAASPGGVRRLLGAGFALIGDLRYPGERVREPSPWGEVPAARVFSHDNDEDGEAPHLALLRAGDTDQAAVTAFYLDLYARLPFRPAYADLFAQVLHALSTLPPGAPVLIHCTAGKDRTGMLVALIQHLLGVAPDDILAEYLRSDRAPALMRRLPQIADNVERRHGVRPAPAVLEALMAAKAEYLATCFDAMTDRCGSVDGYLREIGVDAGRALALQERLLAR